MVNVTPDCESRINPIRRGEVALKILQTTQSDGKPIKDTRSNVLLANAKVINTRKQM
jgi:hypothetical protein